MRLLLVAVVVTLWAIQPNPAQAQADIYTRCSRAFFVKGFTYNQFADMSPIAQMYYMNGWLTGFAGGIAGYSEECSKRITACVDATTDKQRLAIIEKHAKEHPESWGQQHVTALYMWASFVAPCFTGKISIK